VWNEVDTAVHCTTDIEQYRRRAWFGGWPRP
jgi:hypothetical protein